jgi:hypothetical protein
MNHVCQEIATYSRACERLLSKEGVLTEDERSLLEYYVNELSREFLSKGAVNQPRYTDTAAVKPSATP